MLIVGGGKVRKGTVYIVAGLIPFACLGERGEKKEIHKTRVREYGSILGLLQKVICSKFVVAALIICSKFANSLNPNEFVLIEAPNGFNDDLLFHR